jgi:uncharacterized protein
LSTAAEIERIEPRSAKAWEVTQGQQIRIIDLEGQQVADVVAFNPTDHTEHFSQAWTRMALFSTKLRVGDTLYSNLGEPLLTIVADDVGVHDVLFAPCDRRVFEQFFDLHLTGCREHLSDALARYGVEPHLVTDTFNAFENTRITDDGDLVIATPTSTAGDAVLLRAERDLIIGVSACAAAVTDCNGGSPSAIGVEILEPSPSGEA